MSGITEHPAPCDGCSHAVWYESAGNYGRCAHPAVVAAEQAPMVLKARKVHEIMRWQFSFPKSTDCTARTPITEPAPFTTHVAAAVDALNAERGT